MLRQKTKRHNLEGPSLANPLPYIPQALSCKVIRKKRTPIVCHHREEMIAHTGFSLSIIRHVNAGSESNNNPSAWATSCPSYLLFVSSVLAIFLPAAEDPSPFHVRSDRLIVQHLSETVARADVPCSATAKEYISSLRVVEQFIIIRRAFAFSADGSRWTPSVPQVKQPT